MTKTIKGNVCCPDVTIEQNGFWKVRQYPGTHIINLDARMVRELRDSLTEMIEEAEERKRQDDKAESRERMTRYGVR